MTLSKNISRYANNLMSVTRHNDSQYNNTQHNDNYHNERLCIIIKMQHSIATLSIQCHYAEEHYVVSHFHCYAGFHYAGFHYAGCHYIKRHFVQCLFGDCRYAACRYPERHHGGCGGVVYRTGEREKKKLKTVIHSCLSIHQLPTR